MLVDRFFFGGARVPVPSLYGKLIQMAAGGSFRHEDGIKHLI